MELEEIIAKLQELGVSTEKVDDPTVLLCKAKKNVSEMLQTLTLAFGITEFRILGILEHPLEGTTVRTKIEF